MTRAILGRKFISPMDPPRGASHHRKHTLLRLQHPEPTEENYARIQRSIEQQTAAVERARNDKRRYVATTANYAAAEKRLLAEENQLDVLQQALEDMRYAAGHRPMRRAVTPPPVSRPAPATTTPAIEAAPASDDDGYVSDAGPGMLSSFASRAGGLARGLAPVAGGLASGLAKGAAGLVPLAGSVARGAGSIAGGIANKYADYKRRRAIEQAARAEAERINADIEERQLAEQMRLERAAQREERDEQLAAMPAEMSQIRREAEEAVAAGRRAKEEIARMKASEAEAAARREQQSPPPPQPKLNYQPEPFSSDSEDEPIRKPAAPPLPPPQKPAFVVPPLNLPTPPPMPPRPKETFSLPPLPPTISNYEEASRVADENQRILNNLLPRAEELARKANTAATLAQLDTEIEEAQRRRAAAKAEASRKMANAAGFYTSKPEVGKETPNKDFPTAPPSDSVLDNEVYKALKDRGDKLPDLTTKKTLSARRSGVELQRPGKGKSATELEELRRQIKASSAMAEATRNPNARFMYDFDPHHEDPHPNFDENYTLHRQEDDAKLKPLRPLPDPADYDRPPKRREALRESTLDRVTPITPPRLQLPVEPEDQPMMPSSASSSAVSTPRSSSASASSSAMSTPRSSAAGSPIRFRSEPSPPREIRLGRRGVDIKPLPPPVTADRPVKLAAQPPEMVRVIACSV